MQVTTSNHPAGGHGGSTIQRRAWRLPAAREATPGAYDPGNFTETATAGSPLGGGTAQGWHADDDNYVGDWSLALPFTFDFYGKSYSSLWVSKNGYLDFTDRHSDYFNADDKLEASVRIAVLWEDLTTTEPGDDIFVTSTSDYVAIRWAANVSTETGLGNAVNAEVVLFADGDIQFNYGTAQDPGGPRSAFPPATACTTPGRHSTGAASLPPIYPCKWPQAAGLPAGLALNWSGAFRHAHRGRQL